MNPRESLVVHSLPEEVQRTGATVVEMNADRGYPTYSPNTWLATKRESTFASRLHAPIRVAMRNPAMRASYSASLFVVVNSKRSA
nr:hypothetical protein [Tanacetum cinerariifolium]